MPKTLLFSALPFGYGPAAKVLVLAAEARRRGLAATFAGSRIAYELVARDTQLFADVADSAAAAGRTLDLVRRADAVVSVMDRDIADMARAQGKPLFVVDSLLWMRDAAPPQLRAARRYWAQKFHDESPAPGMAPLHVRPVGPIVAPRLQRQAPGRGLLVNLGGYDSPVNPGGELRYAEFVVGCLLDSELGRAFAGQITVAGGHRSVVRIGRRFSRARLHGVSLSHDAALQAFETAELVLSAPGLTASLECFQLGVPVLFLPPQSFSQWCILRHMRACGLAPCSFHWEDVWAGPRIAVGMPEQVRNPLVRAAIDELCGDGRAGRTLAETLSRARRDDHPGLAAAQRRFFETLGRNGAVQIAEELAVELGAAEERK